MLEKGKKIKLPKMFPMKICQWYQFPAFLEIKNVRLWEGCWVGGMYPTLPFPITCEGLRNVANFLATTERLNAHRATPSLKLKKIVGQLLAEMEKN